jgi:hypothetical protein
LEAEEGEICIAAGKDINALKRAATPGDLRTGQERMSYKDAKGRTQNDITNEFHIIQGRTVYRTADGTWVDSATQDADEPTAVEFGSDDYYSLLKSDAKACQFLCLGQKVQFMSNDKAYVITEPAPEEEEDKK